MPFLVIEAINSMEAITPHRNIIKSNNHNHNININNKKKYRETENKTEKIVDENIYAVLSTPILLSSYNNDVRLRLRVSDT